MTSTAVGWYRTWPQLGVNLALPLQLHSLCTVQGLKLHGVEHQSADCTHHGKAAVLQLLDLHVLAVHARGVEGELVDEARLQDTRKTARMR